MCKKVSQKRFTLIIVLVFCLVFLNLLVYSHLKELSVPVYYKPKEGYEKSSSMKYILIWTSPSWVPLKYMDDGQDTFLKRKCPINNCFVTRNKEYLKDLTSYDVIVFHGPEVVHYNELKYPNERLPYQLYVFACVESSANYPLPKEKFNDFFNVTWTYRLDSDVYFGYVIIRDVEGNIIGPRENMRWVETEKMITVDGIDDSFKSKSVLGAWFVSNCKPISKRNELISKLLIELKKYNQIIDVYGYCGNKECPLHWKPECLDMIKKKYFFYFALENSFSKDYVTEKLLKALQNYAIPVVYGGADYKRFMPEGIYLDANKLSVEELAKLMIDIMNDTKKYSSHFNWRNHYSYHNLEGAIETDPYCKLCEYVNTFNGTKIIHNIDAWWNH